MPSDADLIYDRLIAEEKLKAGTKYERLGAIVFHQLMGQTTVHDLRLRGETDVPHQIDAVVGDERRRVLIEAKDYDRTVDLPVVRNFWGVVDDLKPDDAFIVTTEGFSENATRYAAAKGISLAVLRPPRDEDWENIVRRIELEIRATGQTDPPKVTWEIHPDDHPKFDDLDARGLVETQALELSDANGRRRPFFPILDEQLKEDYAAVPLGGEATIGRTATFVEPTWLHAPGLPPLRVNAWRWAVSVASTTTVHVVADGVGGLAAELVLRSTDGSIHKMFTNRDIQSWTFDGKRVVPRGA